MFIKLENNLPVGYPIIEGNFRQVYPDAPYHVSQSYLDTIGLAFYDFSTPPDVLWSQKLVEVAPVKNEFGIYAQTWEIVDLQGEELDTARTDFQEKQKVHIKGLSDARLDQFARTKDYYSILHAVSYIGSNDPVRRAEAQYCTDVRDATWTKVYEILAEIENGTRPFDTTFAQIEAELPVLTWPGQTNNSLT